MQGDEMKSRTLIGLAVATTFGWAAAAHAGSASETQYPSMLMFENDASAMDSSAAAALDKGTYSEYYLVSWIPRNAGQWEHYVIASEPSSPDTYVLLDDGASVVPMHEVMGAGPETSVMLDGASVVSTYEMAPPDTLLLLDDQAYLVSTYEVISLPSDVMQPDGS
jgi:hypothetical protein